MAEERERDGTPTFARDFPHEPKLDALVAAFDAGDFARVRREAPAVAAESSDGAVKRAAEMLLARTKPGPTAGALIGLAALLLVVLSAWWIAHGGGSDARLA